MAKTSIDEAKCTGCGACIKACPNGVYVLSDGKAMEKNPDSCNMIDCLACIHACIEGAIIFKY
jgi:pyruvate formate lyase activating enzyme